MEEMTMEMNNEVAETTNAVVTEGITDVTVPEVNVTEVPVVENSTGKIDAVQVALGGAAILGLGYLAIKGGKWVIKKVKTKLKTGKKYTKLGDNADVVDEDEAMFEDEDLEEVPIKETEETEEKVEG